jgi:hypothetical protein
VSIKNELGGASRSRFKTFKPFKPFQPPSLSSPAWRGKMKKGD